MGRVVDLADVAVEFVTGEAPISIGMADMIDCLPPSCGPAEVVIRHVAAGPPSPAQPADVERERIAIWIDGDEVRLRDVTGATAQLTPRTAEIGGGGDNAANGFHVLFLFALTHLLAHHDRYVLHAAGLVRGREAYLVLGGSGAGKSTLSIAAMEAGWKVLGDDTVVIRWAGTGLEVAGIPHPMTVPADIVGSLAGRRIGGAVRPRAVVAVELEPGWFPVVGVVAVDHDGSPEGHVAPAETHAMFHRCLGSFVSTVNPPLLREFLPIAATLSRLPGWDLHHGSDPGTRRQVAARLLASATGQAS
jgi:hypothetical protein